MSRATRIANIVHGRNPTKPPVCKWHNYFHLTAGQWNLKKYPEQKKTPLEKLPQTAKIKLCAGHILQVLTKCLGFKQLGTSYIQKSLKTVFSTKKHAECCRKIFMPNTLLQRSSAVDKSAVDWTPTLAVSPHFHIRPQSCPPVHFEAFTSKTKVVGILSDGTKYLNILRYGTAGPSKGKNCLKNVSVWRSGAPHPS